VQNPQDQTVIGEQRGTFSIVFEQWRDRTVEWLRNGVAIPGATGTSYTLPSATRPDNGAKFSLDVHGRTGPLTYHAADGSSIRSCLSSTYPPRGVSYDFNDGMVPADAFVYGAGIASDGVSPWTPFVSLTAGSATPASSRSPRASTIREVRC